MIPEDPIWMRDPRAWLVFGNIDVVHVIDRQVLEKLIRQGQPIHKGEREKGGKSVPKIVMTKEERIRTFLSRVNKTSGCWVWTGTSSESGYGVYFDGSKHVRAHRYYYEVSKGPIPPGMIVMHACDNRPCVNPDHLSVGTHKDNMQDCLAKGRFSGHGMGGSRPKSHCKRGHSLSDKENVYLSKEGAKVCAICRRAWAAARRNQRRTGQESKQEQGA